MTTDCAHVRTLLNQAGKKYRWIPDRTGKPHYIVQLRKPDDCPPRGALTYYTWGIHFGPDGTFGESWGKIPVQLPPHMDNDKAEEHRRIAAVESDRMVQEYLKKHRP